MCQRRPPDPFRKGVAIVLAQKQWDFRIRPLTQGFGANASLYDSQLTDIVCNRKWQARQWDPRQRKQTGRTSCADKMPHSISARLSDERPVALLTRRNGLSGRVFAVT